MVNMRLKTPSSGPFPRPSGTVGNAVRKARYAWTLLFGMVLVGACSPLERIVEPEVSDLQLTVDTLKTSLRDAQRTIVELRAEVESRRQELADVQIARAQLEGRIREAERRLVEARHVIDLQREELAGSRSERERVKRTGAMLGSRMKGLQGDRSTTESQDGAVDPTEVAPANLPSPKEHQSGAVSTRNGETTPSAKNASRIAATALHVPQKSSTANTPSPKYPVTIPARVSVNPGDTLWSIARRYRLSVGRLMTVNQLRDSHIQVGQALWLTEPTTADQDQ